MSADLTGHRVLVTRPAAQSAALMDAIVAAGGEAISFPVIAIEGREPAAIEHELTSMQAADLTIFISSNAVRHGIAAAGKRQVAAIGPATRNALEELGITVDIYPDGGFDSEHLLEHPALNEVAGQTIRIVRGNAGRELLAETLRNRGAQVQEVAVYQRVCVTPGAGTLDELRATWLEQGIEFVVVMSVESLDNLLQILPDDLRGQLPASLLVSPSRRVIQTALERLPDMPSRVAGGPEARDLVEAMVRS